MHLFNLLSALLAFLALVSAAGKFGSQYIKTLSSSNFKKEVFGTDRATVVTFYAPWCGHCQRLAPEYDKAAKNLAGLVDFAALDCDVDENKPLCGEYEVKGFPTVKIFSTPKTKPKDYIGERTASALVKEATREMPSFTKRIKSVAELKKVTSSKPKKPLAILLTDKIAAPTLWKALSADLHKSFTFYSIKDEERFKEIKAEYGLKKTPSIMVWRGEGDFELYDGSLKIGHITHWLKKAKKGGAGKKDEL